MQSQDKNRIYKWLWKYLFVEFGTGSDNEMRCDHSIDRNYQITHEDKRNYFFHLWKDLDRNGTRTEALRAKEQFKKYDTQPYYNYGGLERGSGMPKYTKSNIIKVVNNTFGCSFKEMVVDYYNLTCEGIMCVSPGFEVEPLKV